MVGIQSALGAGPGIHAKYESQEAQIWWGHENLRIFAPMPAIASTAVDSGNTPTTRLRAGLVMAQITATGLWADYDPTKTNGQEVARGVLMRGLTMIDASGSAIQKQGVILIGGLLKTVDLIGLDGTARQQLAKAFVFDDDIAGRGWGGAFLREQTKTENYTVVAADNMTEFVAAGTGAVTFTLPALAKGLRFKFRNQVDENMTVASAEAGNIVAMHNAAADSVAFSTASGKIGGAVIVYSNAAGDKWIVENASAGANTITVA